MKNKYLPFEIGEQYENWEFDLEISDVDKIKGCDSYFYIREINFLGVCPKYVELIFSLDILQVVIMTCEFQSLEQLKQFRETLDSKFGERRVLENENLSAEIYEIENLELRLTYIPLGYRLDLAYGKTKYFRENF